MFFLDHAWLIPLIPALSFVVILLFGKRMPRQGSEVGIVAVGASFVLACGALVQWIKRVQDAERRRRRDRRARPQHRPPRRRGRRRGARCCRSLHHVTWFQNGGRAAHRRHPDRRPRRDDDVRRHARSRCSCTSTRSSTCAATAASPTSTPRCQPLHRVDAAARRRRQHAAAARRLGARRPLLVHADRALVGGEAQLRRRAQGVPHHPHRRHRAADRRDHDVLRRRSARPASARSTSSRSTTAARRAQGRPHADPVVRGSR